MAICSRGDVVEIMKKGGNSWIGKILARWNPVEPRRDLVCRECGDVLRKRPLPQRGHCYREYTCLHCDRRFVVDPQMPDNDNVEVAVIIHHVDERGRQWARCPNCRITFPVQGSSMRDSRHVRCGQRLRVLGEFAVDPKPL